MGGRPRVLIVGAGIAGLTAARSLRDRCDVVVLDKARGVGGRMATRRIGDATLDHGAQFLTTHTETFAQVVSTWEADGIAAPWFTGRVGPTGVTGQPPAAADGHIRYRGVSSMNDIPRHLAQGTSVLRQRRVESVGIRGDGWVLRTGGSGLVADAVMLTAPVPQSLEMLVAGDTKLSGPDSEALKGIRYDPCLAALLPLSGPSGLPDPGAVDPDDGPIDWMADNQPKGVSATPAVTIHATPEESRRLWRETDEEVSDFLLRAAALDSQPVRHAVQVQRWRYAQPRSGHPEPYLALSGVPPLVLAGDAFGAPRVEGAALSGLAGAAAVADLTGCGGPG